ncbi:MAG: hypothetical protein O7C68_04350 [Rickettsia endosymbiont of Ixodes ricinus]|uniref:Uncharacterized protein n=1 Tax=Rickettsia helvetica TaxID=35789 RepID=A0ABP0T2I2_RICHE|nr:hypothetical protein [Rickettsia helvetica]MCZ6896812.1 hypothetical protein [Rickettsia endosymbiont of Ixodes ricinus]
MPPHHPWISYLAPCSSQYFTTEICSCSDAGIKGDLLSMPSIFAFAFNNSLITFRLPSVAAADIAAVVEAFLDKRYFTTSFLFFELIAVLNGVLKQYQH